MNVLLAGKHNHVPFIVGSNANETGQAIVSAYPTGMTMAQYDSAVARLRRRRPDAGHRRRWRSIRSPTTATIRAPRSSR